MRSNRRTSALLRSSFTGENIVAARAGTARDGSPGLDRCTDRQRRLRARLALGLFNDYDKTYGDNTWSCSAVRTYSITLSPRFDSLVIITDCPVNVAGRMASEGPDIRVPGFRFNPEKECSMDAVHMLDITSGAELILTRRVTGRVKPGGANVWSRWAEHHFADLELPLKASADEQAALDRIPAMTPAIETLLAALAVRLDARDPDGRWAMGYWFWDPLQREGYDAFGPRSDPGSLLQGYGDRWELRWSEHPYVEDVALMLTHPIIGVPGCQASEVDGGFDIRLDGSVLALRSWHPDGHVGCNLRPKNVTKRVPLPD